MMVKKRIGAVVLLTALLSGGSVALAAPAALACAPSGTTSSTIPSASNCPRTPTWHCTKYRWTWKGRKCASWRYY
jgi:hypothetical protein